MRIGTAVLLTVLPSALGSSLVHAQEADGSFDFAKGKIEGFELEARTYWHTYDTRPLIGEVVCIGDNEDIRFTVNRVGKIDLLHSQFLVDPSPNGERMHGAHLGDELWLYIDGIRYEFRNIPSATTNFDNFTYPSAGYSGEIVLTWSGTPSVRRSENEAFYPLASLYEQMASASTLAWGMKKADPGAHDGSRVKPGKRFRMDNKGLREAVNWCRRAVRLPAARTLPPDVLERLPKPPLSPAIPART